MKYGEDMSVTSEIGRLREVIVHKPGLEIERVMPRNFGRMFFEDILWREEAAKDHDCLVQVLEKAGVVVHSFQRLLTDTLRSIDPEMRRLFIQRIGCLEGHSPKVSQRLNDYSPEMLAQVLVCGELKKEPVARFLRQDPFAISPLPNLMFLRDCAITVGDEVIPSPMAHSVRCRETLLLSLILRHHVRFSQTSETSRHWLDEFDRCLKEQELIQDRVGFRHVSVEATKVKLHTPDPVYSSGERSVTLDADDVRLTQGARYELEGGNVFVLDSRTLMIGCGERASIEAIDRLIGALFERPSGIRTVLVVAIAGDVKRHLDMFFSIVDKHRYLVYPPIIEEYNAKLTVFKIWVEDGEIQRRAFGTLRVALESIGWGYEYGKSVGYCASVGLPDEPSVGIKERMTQERECHTQALNMLPLAPGKLIAYDRNRETLNYLAREWGYHVVKAIAEPDGAEKGFLEYSADQVEHLLTCDQGVIITLPCKELPRAKDGGPRAMVLPLRRDEVPQNYTARTVGVQVVERNPEQTTSSTSTSMSLPEVSAAGREEEHIRQESSRHPNHGPHDLRLHSETGRLTHVVLHKPGDELGYLTPTNKDALLYDDILDLPSIQQEHKQFCHLLSALGTTVLFIEDMIADAIQDILGSEDADKKIEHLFDEICDLQESAATELGGRWLPEYTQSLRARLEVFSRTPRALARKLIEGIPAEPKHPALYLNAANPFLLTPIPNVLFMRDPGAIVGESAIVCYMKKPARHREGLLLHLALKDYPRSLDFFQDKQQAKTELERSKMNLEGLKEEAARCLARREIFDLLGALEPESAHGARGTSATPVQVPGGTLQETAKGGNCIEADLMEARKAVVDADEKLLQATRRLRDLEKRSELQRVEGGDIVVIHDNILAVGCSERTTPEMLEQLARRIFARQPSIEVIFAVMMPSQRSTMHLDTIFTMISEDECLVYEPMIMSNGIEQVKILQISPDSTSGIVMKEVNSLIKELEGAIRRWAGLREYRLNPILVGGEDPLHQEREQLCDGANVLALAPGVIVGYERNQHTFQELRDKGGYEVCRAEEVFAVDDLGQANPTELGHRILEAMSASVPDNGAKRHSRQKYAIQLSESELSRARGGPRCMSMPLRRKVVSWDRSG